LRWVAALLAADITMFLLAAYIAGALVDHNWSLSTSRPRFSSSSFFFIAGWIAMFSILGLYQRSLALVFRDEFYFTIIAIVFGVMPQLVLFTLVPSLSTSRLVLLLAAGNAIVLVGTTRAALHLLRANIEKRRLHRVLVVGTSEEIDPIMETLRSARNIEPIAWSTANLEEHSQSLGIDSKSLVEEALQERCESIMIAGVRPLHNLAQLVSLAEASGLNVSLALPHQSSVTLNMRLARTGSQDVLVPVRPSICHPVSTVVKRIFDLLAASLALFFCLPVLTIAGILIVLESGWPILFYQERVGRGGSLFKIVKLRTMKAEAGEDWATPGDARITRVGAWLRKSSIDELPQLINVLRGQMSLVGPRPEMVTYEQYFAKALPFYEERRQALPGITGWAQVNVRRNLTPDDASEVLSHDLFYIEHWSVFLDFTVLLKTAAEFLFQRAV
jgi:exopolysaccharide biosynthesis polyprenyl glycosylphosphotransferase